MSTFPAVLAALFAVAPQDPPDFKRDIEPFFSARCNGCHGASVRKSGLRLDRKQDALAGGDRGIDIVPGKSAESRLYRYMAKLDPEIHMPPKGEALTEKQVALVRHWIDAGAPWPDDLTLAPRVKSDHWAFNAPLPVRPPKVKNEAWIRTPIDAFILDRLEREGRSPSPPADRPTFIRRLSLDLLGAPPSPTEVDAFVGDRSEDAFEQLVDRLLASPRFGERWGGYWIETAKNPNNARWRAWVIDSVNRDQPFDQFTFEQIAGDLLPGASDDQKVATGFHRRHDAPHSVKAANRASAVASVWLGLSMSCAECHAHPHDPITQREFYGFYAFFNSVDERSIRAPAGLEQKREALDEAVALYVAGDDPAQQAWEEKVAALPGIWTLPDATEPDALDDGSFLVEDGPWTAILTTTLKNVTAIRLEALTDEALPRYGPGRGNFLLSEFSVDGVPIARAVADYALPGHSVDHAIDADPGTRWSVDLPNQPINATDRCAVFELRNPTSSPVKITLRPPQAIGRMRISLSASEPSQLAGQAVPQSVRDLAAIPSHLRTPEQRAQLRRYYHATFAPDAPGLVLYSKALSDFEKATFSALAPTIAGRAKPRETRIHLRGNPLNTGAAVEPSTPDVLNPFAPTQAPAGRLDLAAWLLHDANPLTSRVEVNRIWTRLFGRGLVATPGDFGLKGDRPSHPELLDWLAREFSIRGWSRKAMIRLIAISAAYRQTAK